MKIVKHYWFIAIALITMISFSSCENDEERGFDISGLYGKTWWGEMGFEDPYGERLYSYITVSVSAILSCRPFFILIFLPCIKMNHYGFSRKSIWKNLETFP